MRIKHKKAISIIVVMLMVLSGLNGVFVGGKKAYAAGSFAGGKGTVDDPYLISTAAELDNVRNHLQAGKYFKLINDIDLTNYDGGVGDDGGSGWMPIGDSFSNIFYGSLDGNGFKIMNLYINRPNRVYDTGLFGIVGVGSEISNIILDNIYVSGYEETGGLVGLNQGTINNSSVTGDVYGRSINIGGLVGVNRGTISNSHATGSVNGGFGVGGLVGQNETGTISNSYATGSVNGSTEVGGLVGINYGTISKSYATGSVNGDDENVGGLVGQSITGTISNSYSTGRVNGGKYVGGLVGGIVSGTISTNYATGEVIGGTEVGGLVGLNRQGTISNSFYDSDTTGQPVGDTGKGVGKSTGSMIDQDTFDSWDFDSVWYMLSDQYPQLWAFTTLTPGTNNGTTKLNNVATGMEYSTDGDNYTEITSTSVDNIHVNLGDTISLRVIGTSPLNPKTLTVNLSNRKPVVIETEEITGITAPVTGATPVTTVTETTYYTGTVAWSPSPVTFAAGTVYSATITLTPKAGYTFTGIAEDFFSVDGATTTNNDADSNVVTAVFPATAALPNSGSTPPPQTPTPPTPPPTNGTVTSTDGKLTLPAGSTGEVSLGDKATVSIPGDATGKDLEITVEEVENTQDLVTNNEVLVSSVFEILKNFSENFTKPVTLTLVFDLAIVKSNQRVAVFYYDEVKKAWVEVVGGKVDGNHISVEVDHFTKFAVFAVTNVPTALNFSDIAGHWAEESIKQAVSNGIVTGYPDGTFKPGKNVTRAEFVVMLMNTLKLQGDGAELTFTDATKIGSWAQNAVAQAVKAGLIKGYEDGTFRPDAPITRAEMAMIVANASGVSLEGNDSTGYADDKDIPVWAKGAVATIKKLGYMAGKGSNQFDPNTSTTRAEAVTVLLKLWVQQSK